MTPGACRTPGCSLRLPWRQIGPPPRPVPEPGDGWLLVCPRVSGGTLTLALFGELDVATSEQLRYQLRKAIRAWHGRLVVDVAGLAFCGIVGVDVLREALRLCAITHRDARTTGMSAQLEWLSQAVPGGALEQATGTTGTASPSAASSDIVRIKMINGDEVVGA